MVAWTAPHTYRNRDGNLYVRYLYWNGDRWNWNYNYLDNDWNDNNPAACATIFISPRHHVGEFCFVSCPFQPPSIFPISSSGSDSARYFLLSIDFVSQTIIKRIFIVSSFLIAKRT